MKTSTITLRISEEEKEKITEIAKKRDIPVSQLIRELCREIFEEVEWYECTKLENNKGERKSSLR